MSHPSESDCVALSLQSATFSSFASILETFRPNHGYESTWNFLMSQSFGSDCVAQQSLQLEI